jgi:hypothetical protein
MPKNDSSTWRKLYEQLRLEHDIAVWASERRALAIQKLEQHKCPSERANWWIWATFILLFYSAVASKDAYDWKTHWKSACVLLGQVHASAEKLDAAFQECREDYRKQRKLAKYCVRPEDVDQ